MKVVIDTNVLVSGVMSPHGPPGRIIDAVLAESLIVIYDDRVMDEYWAVLMRPAFGFRKADVEAILDFMEMAGVRAVAPPLNVVLPDPTDLPFLEVAVAGHADALITGNDRHYKPRRGHHDIFVCRPAEFLSRLR